MDCQLESIEKFSLLLLSVFILRETILLECGSQNDNF